VGPYEFQLIPAPGHTDDSVLLYDKKSKILISGDALYDGKIYDELPNSDKTAFRESLASMKACDVILALPGHNQILDKGGVAAVIERWSPFHRK